jgi:hypothetical protein
MVMKWEKFKGTIKKPGYEATIEMMDLPNPFWQAMFSWLTPTDTSLVVESFEEGKLDQAYEWCVKQIEEHEQRLKQRGDLAS